MSSDIWGVVITGLGQMNFAQFLAVCGGMLHTIAVHDPLLLGERHRGHRGLWCVPALGAGQTAGENEGGPEDSSDTRHPGERAGMRFASHAREVPGCSRGQVEGVGVAQAGGPGSAGHTGPTTGIRGPWPVHPLPGCGQREADALLARSTAVEGARPRLRGPRPPGRSATHGVGGEEPW